MPITSLTVRSITHAIAQLSALCLLTLSMVLSGTTFARAESRDEAIDSATDSFFYSANPQLNQRRLQPDESAYAQEWQAIRTIVAQAVKPIGEVCIRPQDQNYNWEVAVSESTYDRIADAIFYSRNPGMNGRRIAASDFSAARQWQAIRRTVFISVCGI